MRTYAPGGNIGFAGFLSSNVVPVVVSQIYKEEFSPEGGATRTFHVT